MEKRDARLLTSIVCIDTAIQAPEQSPLEYTWNDVEFDHRFVEIYTEHGGGRFGVDCGRVHDEEPVPRLSTH